MLAKDCDYTCKTHNYSPHDTYMFMWVADTQTYKNTSYNLLIRSTDYLMKAIYFDKQINMRLQVHVYNIRNKIMNATKGAKAMSNASTVHDNHRK